MITIAGRDVSRETYDKLRAFEDLVLKWTQRINLVSRSDIDTIWERHIVDSVQVFNLAPDTGDWLDIGSGGGFPGIIVAILSDGRDLTLMESDQRKCTFLRTAIRELDLTARVLTERIEEAPPQGVDVLSARALTDLSGLLAFAERHLTPGGIGLFPKGQRWQEEVAKAQEKWGFQYEAIPSITNQAASVLKIKEIARV
jgi:16S rRNA (guanine527-N7)-methyltransferase